MEFPAEVFENIFDMAFACAKCHRGCLGDMPCWLDDYSQFDAEGFAFSEQYPGREGMLRYKCIHHIRFLQEKNERYSCLSCC